MILRLAIELARNPAPEHRWRRVAVPISTVLFMTMLLAATSLVVMVQREAGRATQRTALVATEPSSKDLLLTRGYDDWNSQQFVVAWIEPAGNAAPILPPGVSQLPKPGQAVVSPELDRLASMHQGLAARYPSRLVLSPEGISYGDELFAYVRVPEDRTIAGEDVVVRARGFGTPGRFDRSFPLFLEPPEEVGTPIVAGTLGLLVLPGLIMLPVGLAAASNVRDRRFEVLRSLGASGRTLAALAVLETMVLAAPGLVAVTILWGAVAPRMGQVPLAGHKVVLGDLELPWWTLATELAVGAVTISSLAVAATAFKRRRGMSRSRPAPQKDVVTPLRAAPLSLAFVAFFLGELFEGDLGGTLNLIGIVAAIGGIPLLLPGVLHTVGGIVGRLGSVPAWMVGRGLQWDPVRASRPFAGYAALILIALAGSGYLASIRDTEATSLSIKSPQAVTVSYWLDPRPGDLSRLADALGTGGVLPTKEDGSTLVVGSTCRELATFFSGTRCDSDDPFRLPNETARMVAERALGIASAKVELVPKEEVDASRSALVLGDLPSKVLEERVKVAAMRTLVAPFVGNVSSNTMVQSPLVPWLVGGIQVAAIVLTVGCLISLTDRLVSSRKHHRQLLNLGWAPGRLAILEAWQFAVPYVAVAAVSFLAGVFICAKLIGVFSGIPMPWHGIGIVLVCVCVVGVFGTGCVSLLSTRSTDMQETLE